MIKILLVDRDKKEHDILCQALPGYSFRAAYSAGEAEEVLRQERFSAILLELHLPDRSGLELLEKLRFYNNVPPIVVFSASNSTRNIVRSMRAGAIEFIPKPYSLDQLKKALAEAVKYSFYLGREGGEEETETSATRFCIGSSQTTRRLRELITLYAESSASILLSGESGSGKEVAARELYARSPQCDGPFVPINCGAIPLTLVESELYGTVEGVYTGAYNRCGYFEQAHGGILFMDEIAEMPLESQVKLLRIIENRQITRLGGRRLIDIDVRIIAATNRNLRERIQSRLFREDLYHRLNVLNLHIPPLRSRKDDIPDLVRHFLKELKAADVSIEQAALMKLVDYEWPGNIRELKNTIERALVYSRRSTIKPEHIVFGESLFPY
jgi:DNA-binding NtrC family response regulator